MASHVYKLSDLTLAIQHALGKPPDSQLTDPVQLVNDALQILVSSQPWTWRQRYAAVDSTANVNALGSLPADFGGLHVLHEGAINANAVSMLAEVVPLVPGASQKTHSTYRYAIETTPQAAASGEVAMGGARLSMV